MKVNQNFILREIAGESMLIPVGAAAAKFNGLITLNETGAFLWERLQQETTEEELVQALLGEYEVSEAVAASAVAAFVKKLEENGFLV